MRNVIRSTVAVLITALVSTPALAQQFEPRVIHNGNTDIVFEGATNADLNVNQYRAFDQFSAAHPDVVRQLRERPMLLKSQKFLANHVQLVQFMHDHPDWQTDFVANPGNYIAPSRHAQKASAERTARNTDKSAARRQ